MGIIKQRQLSSYWRIVVGINSSLCLQSIASSDVEREWVTTRVHSCSPIGTHSAIMRETERESNSPFSHAITGTLAQWNWRSGEIHSPWVERSVSITRTTDGGRFTFHARMSSNTWLDAFGYCANLIESILCEDSTHFQRVTLTNIHTAIFCFF